MPDDIQEVRTALEASFAATRRAELAALALANAYEERDEEAAAAARVEHGLALHERKLAQERILGTRRVEGEGT